MQRKTGRQPQALSNRPKPIAELEVYRTAFRRLSRARKWVEGAPQAISIEALFAYCSGLGLTSCEFRETFVDLLQDMDAVFLEHVGKRKQSAPSASSAIPAKSDVVPVRQGSDNA